ncbi:MAG: SagB family peptide dehydrogenase [Thermoanaerobaculia bacterium]|nr:SagB family peptide dehydrogenase [Thermoanaerobaculia bacterium]
MLAAHVYDALSLPKQVCRAPSIHFCLREVATVELRALLRGEVSMGSDAQLAVLNPFTGKARPCSVSELEFLASVPEREPVDTEQLRQRAENANLDLSQLLAEGLLTHADDERWNARKSIPWDANAALFQASCLFEGSPDSGEALTSDSSSPSVEEQLESATSDVERFIRQYGPPPPVRTNYAADVSDSAADSFPVELADQPELDSELFRLLSRRRTCRRFLDRPIDLKGLSTLLRWTFGVHATISLSERYTVPLKTSPSGGAVHPIEAFPLIRNVEGLRSGLYYYDPFGHALQPVRLAPEGAMKSLMIGLASGQEFAGNAAVLILLVARLDRNFWKYRSRSRTYAVLHQDAGHLGQSFYLIATKLGLGAFYSAAVAGSVTSRILGIDENREAPLGLCGCGMPKERLGDWPSIERFVPGAPPMPGEADIRTVRVRPTGSSAESSEPVVSDHYFRGLRLTPPLDKD